MSHSYQIPEFASRTRVGMHDSTLTTLLVGERSDWGVKADEADVVQKWASGGRSWRECGSLDLASSPMYEGWTCLDGPDLPHDYEGSVVRGSSARGADRRLGGTVGELYADVMGPL